MLPGGSLAEWCSANLAGNYLTIWVFLDRALGREDESSEKCVDRWPAGLSCFVFLHD